MSKKLGSSATLEISPDGSTYTKVSFAKKLGTPFDVTAVDSTDNDSGGFKSNLQGDMSVKITGTFNYDQSDAGQALAVSYGTTKTTCYIRYRGEGAGTGLPQSYGQAVITKCYFDSEHEKIQELTLEASSTGTWTFGVQ